MPRHVPLVIAQFFRGRLGWCASIPISALLMVAALVANIAQAQVTSLDPNYTVSLFASGIQLPENVVFRPAQNDLLVTEENGAIKRVDGLTGAVTVFAEVPPDIPPDRGIAKLYGLAINSAGNVFAPALTAGPTPILDFDSSGVLLKRLPFPERGLGVAFDSADNLYVVGQPLSGATTGTAIYKYSAGYAAPPTVYAAGLAGGQTIAFNAAGELFATDFGPGVVYRIKPGGMTAASHTVVASGLFQPFSVAIEPLSQTLFIGDRDGTVQHVDSSGAVKTFATGFSNGSSDGLAFDQSGNLYVTDKFVGAIWKFTRIVGTTILPVHGGNAGAVTVQITGTGVQSGATVKLTGLGPDIIGANTTLVAASVLSTTFDLTGAVPGSRTVVVTNPDGTFVTITDGFSIDPGGSAQVRITKIGSPVVAPGRTFTYYLLVNNIGTIDAHGVQVSEFLDKAFQLQTVTPRGLGTVEDFQNAGVILWNAETIPARGQTTLSYQAQVGSSTQVGSTVTGGPACASVDYAATAKCLRSRAISAGVACEKALLKCIVAGVACFVPPTEELVCPIAVVTCGVACINCGISPGDLDECIKTSAKDCTQVNENVENSLDPNGLAGPQGIGNLHWISDNALLYMASFENKKTAELPARVVSVSNPLNPSAVDPATLEIGPITVIGHTVSPPSIPLVTLGSYTTDIDLRPEKDIIVRARASLNPARNTLNWTFTSLDPATHQPPVDPLAGFLAPGEDGSVAFTIQPSASLSTNATISDAATIVFDTNSPIVTPEWTNTVDKTSPISQVSILPTQESTSCFRPQWNGSDIGAGLKNFTIFVSDNGRPYTSWLSGTTTSTATFQGQAGHSYAFYSQATDFVGNVEATKTTPDATTTVAANASCNGRPTLTALIGSRSHTSSTETLTVQFTNNGVGNAPSSTLNQITFRTLAGTGSVTLASPALPVSLGSLAAGASTTVTLTLNVPSTVKEFSVAEQGNLQDMSGKIYSFSVGQGVFP